MMRNNAAMLTSVLLTACASAPNHDELVGATLPPRPPIDATAAIDDAIVAIDTAPVEAEPEVALASAPAVSLAAYPAFYEPNLASLDLKPFSAFPAEGLHKSRTTIKGGLYSAEDADELDDGFIFNVSWMRFFTKLFALELEAGYFDADGDDAGISGDVWGSPLMVNARLNVPIWVLDLYGGLGLGGIYYDAEFGAADDDGFLLGGNAFLGATINLAEAVALGLEVKYYSTEDIDKFNASLDAVALMLTLGFSR